MKRRTWIKICGLTREQDVRAAIDAGADALGFVFYPKSPRYVTAKQAADLMSIVPPFITTVGLFVNTELAQIRRIITEAPVALLQFHGDESVAHSMALADAVNRPFIQAKRIGSSIVAEDLLEYAQAFSGSALYRGLLLDTLVDTSYGGSGKVFDWSLIPKELAHQVVLSGGLNVHNVTDAVNRIGPFAVDVSSGVEQAKGIKDITKMRAFIAAVRQADSMR